MMYVTDSIRLLGEGKYMKERWYDIIAPSAHEEIDADEVVLNVIAKAGLEVSA